MLEDRGRPVNALAFSSDSRRLVTASANDHGREPNLKLWDLATGQELFSSQQHTSSVWSAAFSPDDRRLVTSSSDGAVLIWDSASGKVLQTLRESHKNMIISCAFSPDDHRIAGASTDCTAKVRDATTGRVLSTLKGHVGQVWAVAFPPTEAAS